MASKDVPLEYTATLGEQDLKSKLSGVVGNATMGPDKLAELEIDVKTIPEVAAEDQVSPEPTITQKFELAKEQTDYHDQTPQ